MLPRKRRAAVFAGGWPCSRRPSSQPTTRHHIFFHLAASVTSTQLYRTSVTSTAKTLINTSVTSIAIKIN